MGDPDFLLPASPARLRTGTAPAGWAGNYICLRVRAAAATCHARRNRAAGMAIFGHLPAVWLVRGGRRWAW